MIDTLMIITSGELIIGAVMFVVGGIKLKYFYQKSEHYRAIYSTIMLFLVFSAGHNLIGLGIWGLALALP